MLRPPVHAVKIVPVGAKRLYSNSNRFTKVKHIEYSASTTGPVKDFDPLVPARFKKSFRDYPAIAKWFVRPEAADNEFKLPKLNTEYLEQFNTATVPLELTSSLRDGPPTFERFEAPLSLLLSHMTGRTNPESRLYLAQHNLADLPPVMQEDLPTPGILKELGKGDIYASSVWMGRPPTRTPLHRDPNPNLFVQLSGKKVVRLLRPEVGKAMYERVRAGIGKAGGRASMRGEEMMEGKELEALESAVWDDEQGGYMDVKGLEIQLKSGDGLYIPLGWWHAVHGVGEGPNVSANWWFR